MHNINIDKTYFKLANTPKPKIRSNDNSNDQSNI